MREDNGGLKSGNPVLEGWYADPEPRIFDGKYWIYPTCSAPYDEQTWFDAFSSDAGADDVRRRSCKADFELVRGVTASCPAGEATFGHF